MNLLDQLANEYDEKYSYVKSVLDKSKTTLWKNKDDCFFILSPSAKKEGYQLTFFNNNSPISDQIRETPNHIDFINELIVNNVQLENSVKKY